MIRTLSWVEGFFEYKKFLVEHLEAAKDDPRWRELGFEPVDVDNILEILDTW